jgi:hypothetical protein
MISTSIQMKKADAKHPHTHTGTPIEGSGILTVLQFANGEADVQPSLLPGDFTILQPNCQEEFLQPICVNCSLAASRR